MSAILCMYFIEYHVHKTKKRLMNSCQTISLIGLALIVSLMYLFHLFTLPLPYSYLKATIIICSVYIILFVYVLVNYFNRMN